jgi:enoyl-CoA hydratase
MTAELLTARHGRVLVVTINRPEARNAINRAVAEGIAQALDELDDNAELAVGVLTGASPGFSAGMDLKAFVAGERPSVGDRGFAGIVRRGARKPLVAAIEGFAVAGGFEVALACDIMVAAREAKMGIPEVRRSLVAAGGALLRLPRRMPYHAAMEMALTGDLMTSDRLHALGVVSRLCDEGKALETGIALAERIAANGPLALAATKRVVQEAPRWSPDEMWDRQAEVIEPVFGSDDAREGARAFAEKRSPIWQGR